MAERIPKTLADLQRVMGTAQGYTAAEMAKSMAKFSEGKMDQIIKRINELYKTEQERLKVYEVIGKKLGEHLDTETKIGKLVEESLKRTKEEEERKEKIAEHQKKIKEEQQKTKEQAEKYGNVLQDVAEKTLSKILQQNKEIFQTAKDMQLEGNLTWKQYSQAYDEAFKSARRINQEVGQSIANAREMIETQNYLLRGGFRGINVGDIASISGAVAMMTRTLGDFPNELLISLQQGYRQFGQQTDQFVTQLGNQINAFSNTFGVQTEMLAQTVSFMVQENAFLYRNNMQAQARANQNLIRAAALSGQMGLSSASFVSDLASTSQFGTMSEMAEIYQGGALLQGFDTSQFQQMMQGGDAASATEMLLGSIGQTLGGMDDQYLRAEYMQRIGGAFGLSRDDLLMITANADNLGEYSAELAEKMADTDTSMVDELGELKMSVIDRLDNWWVNTNTSQQLGKTLQDLGLVGVDGTLKYILAQVTILTGQSLTGGAIGKGLAGMFTGGGTAGPASLANAPLQSSSSLANVSQMSGLARFGMGAGGVALGAGSNVFGRSIQSNTNFSDTAANVTGGAVNILGGIAGGALTGGAIGNIPGAIAGGIIGGVGGLINTIAGAQERTSAMQDMEDQERAAARQRMQASQQVSTGDPVVDAINNMNSNLTAVLNDNFSESIQMSFVLDTANRTDAGR